ncbi:MAG: TauD/TfdA family dioxygenase [Rhodospirillaceae bacterium]|jgi:taurine dioxygenase
MPQTTQIEPQNHISGLNISYPDAVIGAEISGVDLSQPLDDETFAKIEEIFNERSVLCIRGQEITAEQYIAFAKRFGNVEKNFLDHYHHPDHDEVLLVSNIKENGEDIGHADAGRVWHTDMSFMDCPPRATVLYALEVPVRDGVVRGDTNFASAAAAYDSLPHKTKEQLEDLIVVHDVFGRRAKTGTGTQDNDKRKKMPNVRHPFVRVHPLTGRKCLYVSPGECIGVEGMDAAEGVSLINEHAKLITQEPFRYRHHWQVGDILMWDNCAVQHLATFDYKWPDERRLIWRITVGATKTM